MTARAMILCMRLALSDQASLEQAAPDHACARIARNRPGGPRLSSYLIAQFLRSVRMEICMLRYSTLLGAIASLLMISAAFSQPDGAADYPNRPVKIIVSVPAGGGVDTVTRIFAAGLQQKLGQPFVIENR